MRISRKIGVLLAVCFLTNNLRCAAKIASLRVEKFNQLYSSDPGVTSDNRQIPNPLDEGGYLLNALQNKIFVMSVKHNQFLGQPLVAKLSPQELGITAGAHLYDYYLVSLQFNVPPMRNVPLNKYRYARFDSIFSIVPELQYEGRTDLIAAGVRFDKLQPLLEYPEDQNLGMTLRIEALLKAAQNSLSDLKIAIAQTGPKDVKEALEKLASELTNEINAVPKGPARNDDLTVDRTLKSVMAQLVETDTKIVDQAQGAHKLDKTNLVNNLNHVEALKKSFEKVINNSWTLEQRADAITKAIDLACAGLDTVQQTVRLSTKLSDELKDTKARLVQRGKNLVSGQQKELLGRVNEDCLCDLLTFQTAVEKYLSQPNLRKRAVYGNYRELDHQRDALPPRNFRVISIYPTNEILDVNFKNEQSLDVKAEPKYMSFSGGSVDYKTTDTTDYKYKLPKVVGTTTHHGCAAWTYYPAKRQPIMLGNKSTFAILQVEKATKGVLRINACLNYETALTIPAAGANVYDQAEVPLNQYLTVDSLLRLRCADLGGDGVVEMFKANYKKGSQTPLELVVGRDQDAFIKTSSKVFRLEPDGVLQVSLDGQGKPVVARTKVDSDVANQIDVSTNKFSKRLGYEEVVVGSDKSDVDDD